KKNVRNIGILGNVIVVALALLISTYSLLQPLENAMYDYNMDQTDSGEYHENIIVIEIDDYSIEQIGRFPWSRDVYGALIESLNDPEFKPKVIGFDILFDTETDPEIDGYLAEALSNSGNVILPLLGNTEEQGL